MLYLLNYKFIIFFIPRREQMPYLAPPQWALMDIHQYTPSRMQRRRLFVEHILLAVFNKIDGIIV